VGTAASAVRSSKARQCVRTIVADHRGRSSFCEFLPTRGPLSSRRAGRQPLLWAALAFAAGIATGVYTWRPPLWWAAAFVVIAASGVFLSRRRWRSAFLLGMGTSFVLGAFIIQVSGPNSSGESRVLQFANGSEVVVTAHVTKEGTPQEEGGNARQRLDLATEQIARGNEQFVVQLGLRVSIYEPQPKPELEPEQRQEARGVQVRLFHHGERLRFPAKLSAL
jgi:hypothetical protein